MKSWALFNTLCIAGLLCSPAAYAEQTDSKRAGKTGGESTGSQNKQASEQPPHVRLSSLLGANVKSSDGQSLGEIEDIVVNPDTGQIQFAVIGKGGFLGMGEKRCPVPWQAVTVKKSAEEGLPGKPSLTVNVARQKLQSAPTMKDKQFSELNEPDYIISVYRFYEIEPVGVGGTGQESQTESRSQQNSKGSEEK